MDKYFSLHYTKKKFVYLILCYILVYIVLNIFDLLTNNKNTEEKIIEYPLLDILMENIGRSLYFIPEIIVIWKISRREKEKGQKSSILKYEYKMKDYAFIGMIAILSLINNFAAIFLEIRKKRVVSEADHAFFYLMFLIITYFLFKTIYYKHQYISIICIIILGFLRFIFKMVGHSNEKIELKDYLIEIPLIIISNICECLCFGYYKVLLDKYYFSPYKILYLFGVIISIIMLFLYFIISFIPCSKDYCLVEYDNKKYLDNIFYYFSNISGSDIFINLFFCILYASYNIFLILIIQNYQIFYIFFPIQIADCIEDIQEIILSDNPNATTISLIIVTYIFEILITLVFIEILEIKLCGLNKYFRKNIRQRSEADVYLSFHMQRDTTDMVVGLTDEVNNNNIINNNNVNNEKSNEPNELNPLNELNDKSLNELNAQESNTIN